jgi:ceramide glucosyltransferase
VPETLLWWLTAASWVYWLFALWSVRSFFRAVPEAPEQAADFTPPVSILKPVRGLDAGAYENFVSFCQQDYLDYEIVFGVADPRDPAVAVIERLQRDFPEIDIAVVFGQASGANRKAALLDRIAGHARNPVLVVSDSDTRVTPDYLRRVVAPLADERIGLVTCTYRGDDALSLPAKLESLYMGVTFLPSALVAGRFLGLPFALGASVALRKDDLARMGGFRAISDYLADDYQLGSRIYGLGLRVRLSNYVIVSIIGRTKFRDQWEREVRWARCNRVSRPHEYPGILIMFTTPLAGALALVTGFTLAAKQVLGMSVLLRWVVAYLISGYTGDKTSRRCLVLLPLRDFLSFVVWAAGAAGKGVSWRGEDFILEHDGRMRAA